MPYTVWSRGRLIGDTDLGFRRLFDTWRGGWFHPNAQGDRVMDLVAAPLPAIGAEPPEAGRNGVEGPTPEPSALLADLAEWSQHARALELELRGEDGSVVPTADISFQDTHRLLAIGEQCLAEAGDDGGFDSPCDDPLDPIDDERLEIDVLHDLEMLDGGFDGWANDVSPPWTAEEPEEEPLPQYQIYVMLLDGDAIP